MQLYDLTQSWVEDGVTWYYRDIDAPQTWTTVGGTLGSELSTLAFPGGTGWITLTVPAATVQSWVNNGSVNYGLLVKCSDETHISPYPVKENFLRIVSSENTNTSLRPKLSVTFTGASNIGPNAQVSNDPSIVLAPGSTNALTAEASDSDGTVASVAFYVDGSLVGTDTSAPYSIQWVATPGSHDVHVVATDNGSAQTTSEAETINCAAVIYSTDMDSDPGWSLGSPWSYGTPSGIDGSTMDCYGEPAAGYTGSGVIGHQLASPYYVGGLTPTAYAAMPAINCAGYTNVTLTFRSWLGASINWGGDARIQVSTDGSAWTDIWVAGNYYSYHAGTWPLRTYDISAVADNQPTVYIRWSQTGGDNWYYAYCGWNLDDVQVTGLEYPDPIVILTGPASSETLGSPETLIGTPVGFNDPIARVEFYQDGLLLGEDTSPPYQWAWRANPLGSQSLTAKAYDTGGFSTTSVPRSVAVLWSETIYSADMSSAPSGWSYEGSWAHGTPTGGGGQYGSADPTAGHTGGSVIGYNLSGDYAEITSTEWASTPAIDCSGHSGVQLTFYRWLGVEQPAFDHAYLEVSDGSVTQTVWQNTGTVSDGSWQLVTYDISAVADGKSTVFVRWGMGITDSSWFYCGWNIDDVLITGTATDMSRDLDGDGLADFWEQGRLGGTNQPSGGPNDDLDGDNRTNEEEFIAGTNPDDATDVLDVAIDASGSDIVLSWLGLAADNGYFGVSNRYYTLQSCTNLTGGTWTDVGPFSDILGSDSYLWCTNTPDAAHRFYRVNAVIAP
jgi:hypothetical protein